MWTHTCKTRSGYRQIFAILQVSTIPTSFFSVQLCHLEIGICCTQDAMQLEYRKERYAAENSFCLYISFRYCIVSSKAMDRHSAYVPWHAGCLKYGVWQGGREKNEITGFFRKTWNYQARITNKIPFVFSNQETSTVKSLLCALFKCIRFITKFKIFIKW